MQNTMVRGNGQPRKKMILGDGEKNEKGQRKKEGKLHLKREKGLKNASFWAINSKKIAGESSDPPAVEQGEK